MNLKDLLAQLAEQEKLLTQVKFLAPCLPKGLIKTRVAGLICKFQPQPGNLEGWGIFQPLNQTQAKWVEEASYIQVAEYLQFLLPLRVQLVHPLRGQTWLAYPVNESDMRQRLKTVKPVVVHLVTEGMAFETAIARWDGQAWWFEELDRRADPRLPEQLREHLQQGQEGVNLKISGLTPENRTAYSLAWQQTAEGRRQQQQTQAEKRLDQALKMGGGKLSQMHDRGDYWQVEWTTQAGEKHLSAISKTDLTVMSAGICLSGRDHDFDLQSLVGVVEQAKW